MEDGRPSRILRKLCVVQWGDNSYRSSGCENFIHQDYLQFSFKSRMQMWNIIHCSFAFSRMSGGRSQSWSTKNQLDQAWRGNQSKNRSLEQQSTMTNLYAKRYSISQTKEVTGDRLCARVEKGRWMITIRWSNVISLIKKSQWDRSAKGLEKLAWDQSRWLEERRMLWSWEVILE